MNVQDYKARGGEMSELKRYDVYKSSQSYFIDGCPMYKCSDVDPKLDEIAKLKAAIIDVAAELEDDLTLGYHQWAYDRLMEAAK